MTLTVKAVLRLGIMALLLCRAIAFADTPSLAQAPEWLALLHYDGERSQITDKAFFLSATGRSDPQAELDATVAAFVEGTGESVCRFPARYDYLREVMPEVALRFKVRPCPALAEYEAKVPFDKVSVVFATEYIPNPTTMMGHLFLKIEGNVKGRPAAHALSFYADLGKVRSTAEFVVGSLFAGTDGVYLLEPYRDRRDSYIYEGKRSIWEYELTLTPAQRRMLVLHAWEMKGIDVSYDLRANNCGSAIIRLLMVAEPKMAAVLYKSYVTPADLLRELKDGGWFGQVAFVPSRQYAVRHPDGRGGVVPPKDNVTRKPPAAHVSADYTRMGHDGFMTVGLAPAYNQLMSRNAYAEQEYEVNLFGLDVGIADRLDKVNIQKLDVVSFASYLPVKRLDASLSRAMSIGIENSGFGMETGKVFPKAFGGVGYTVSILDDAVYAYGMLNGGYSYYGQNHVLTMAPEVGAIVRQGDFGKAQVSYETFASTADYKYDNRLLARQTVYLGRDLSVNARYEHVETGRGAHRNLVGIGLGFAF